MRKDISTLVTLSAAIGVLLLVSPLIPLSNPLLQSAQAQTNLRFSTPIPANGTDSTQGNALTFDAQGETFISSEKLEANGTYQITDSSSGQVLSSGSISRVQGCCLSNPSNGDKITILAGPGNTQILTSCSTSASNNIDILPEISAILALLNVLLLLLLLKEEMVLHSLLLHLEPPHKIVMAMEYLTQVINVLITLTQDALKKEILDNNYTARATFFFFFFFF